MVFKNQISVFFQFKNKKISRTHQNAQLGPSQFYHDFLAEIFNGTVQADFKQCNSIFLFERVIIFRSKFCVFHLALCSLAPALNLGLKAHQKQMRFNPRENTSLLSISDVFILQASARRAKLHKM